MNKLEGAFSLSLAFRNIGEHETWVQTNVYGPTDYDDREDFWGELAAIRGWWNIPWCLCGDFNATKSPKDRMDGRMNRREAEFFNNFIDSFCL